MPGFEGTKGSWDEEDVLVTVKAYPNPSAKYRETSCVAGIRLRDQEWVRIHPVPFRMLPSDQRFKKFAIIKAWLSKSSDPRAESYRYFVDSDIQRVGGIGTADGWRERNELVLPFKSDDLETLRQSDPFKTSLGLVRVRSVDRLTLVPQTPGWSPKDRAKLERRGGLTRPVRQLERPPFEVYYHWHCDNPDCRGHRMKVLDWEVLESVRKWYREYPHDQFEDKFRETYEHYMATRDLHFFVGTMLRWPNNWTIIGLYYPPKPS